MRNSIIYPLVFLTTLLFSCEESERGQFPVDSIAPGEVKEPQVRNVPGGAVITYTIPGDEDLLYVKAVYTLDNGTVMEQKASSYSNSLKIEGIGRSRDLEVTLIAGDRSQNESRPVKVVAKPLDAPIYSILNSIQASNDFGGIRLTWANPTEAEVVISVSTPDGLGKFVAAENYYTKSRDGKGAVRGFEAKSRVFGISLRDRWGNVTDTIKNSFSPLYEVEFSKTKFARWNPVGIPYNQYAAAYSIEKMWDNTIAGFYLTAGVTYPFSFTFDLGQAGKLSRIKHFQREAGAQLYTGQNVKRFELWGSATPNVTADFTGWTKLGDFEIYKPSGLPMGQVSNEDREYALAGDSFDISPDAPPVRYIRYVIKESFGGGPNVAVAEMSFFGDIK